jgi:hypothetical protein
VPLEGGGSRGNPGLPRVNDVEVRKVPVALVEVEPVADEELVRDGEPDVAHGQVVDEAPVGPIEQRDRRDRSRTAKRQRPHEEVERQSRIDDVLHHEYVTTADLAVEVLEQAYPGVSACRSAAISGQLDELQLVGNRDRAREVGEEDDAGFERRDEDRIEPPVVGGDLAAELADACGELGGREVDLADALVGRLYDASCRPYR